tara:strand:- start:1953 stop:3041 length:1089 start_codon:yes stop_codon:yes gene_type:complete
MLVKVANFLILSLYFLVLAVVLDVGPIKPNFATLVLGMLGLAVFVIILSSLAKSIDLVDKPDDKRKNHLGAIPLIGGLSIFISLVYGAILLGINDFFQVLLISLIPLIIIGILDDLRGISVIPRLIVQVLASWIVIIFTDVYLRDLGDLFGQGVVELNEFGIPFTIFCVVGICNAFNMLDGKDGLTGSVSLLVLIGLMILLNFNGYDYQLGMILIPTLLVFLAFNMNLFGINRKVFLGDHGALGLGHLIAWNLIYFTQEVNVMTPASALWIIFYPLTDTLVTFLRRLRSDRSIFKPDRYHLHFILTDKGLSDIKVYLIIIGISFTGAFFAVLSNLFNISDYLILYAYLTGLFFFFLITKKSI